MIDGGFSFGHNFEHTASFSLEQGRGLGVLRGLQEVKAKDSKGKVLPTFGSLRTPESLIDAVLANLDNGRFTVVALPGLAGTGKSTLSEQILQAVARGVGIVPYKKVEFGRSIEEAKEQGVISGEKGFLGRSGYNMVSDFILDGVRKFESDNKGKPALFILAVPGITCTRIVNLCSTSGIDPQEFEQPESRGFLGLNRGTSTIASVVDEFGAYVVSITSTLERFYAEVAFRTSIIELIQAGDNEGLKKLFASKKMRHSGNPLAFGSGIIRDSAPPAAMLQDKGEVNQLMAWLDTSGTVQLPGSLHGIMDPSLLERHPILWRKALVGLVSHNIQKDYNASHARTGIFLNTKQRVVQRYSED